jgi:hypothetical protein
VLVLFLIFKWSLSWRADQVESYLVRPDKVTVASIL